MWGNNGGSKRSKMTKVETLVGEGTSVDGDMTFSEVMKQLAPSC